MRGPKSNGAGRYWCLEGIWTSLSERAFTCSVASPHTRRRSADRRPTSPALPCSQWHVGSELGATVPARDRALCATRLAGWLPTVAAGVQSWLSRLAGLVCDSVVGQDPVALAPNREIPTAECFRGLLHSVADGERFVVRLELNDQRLAGVQGSAECLTVLLLQHRPRGTGLWFDAVEQPRRPVRC